MFERVLHFAAAFVAALLLSPGVCGAQRPDGKPAERVAAATAVTPAPVAPSYRLSAGDGVQMMVFGEAELTTTTRIDKEGSINIPMVGLVKIAGQTVREASKTLETHLREYLVKPQVALSIVNYSKRRFTILGQVNRPGTYELPDEASLNLLEAIGMAGGYTRIANTSKITLKRSVGGKETTMTLDGKSMSDRGAERFPIEAGDTISVGEKLF